MISYGNQGANAELVIFYGNCQTPFLAQLLAAADGERGYLCFLNHGPAGEALEQPTAEQMRRCVFYFEQYDSQVQEIFDGSTQGLLRPARDLCLFMRDGLAHCPKIVFPSFILTDLWPFSTALSPRNVAEPGYVWGRYPYGNWLAEEIVSSGVTGPAALDAYHARSAEMLKEPQEIMQAILQKLLKRDEQCDVKIADYVWANFQTQHMFMTYGHMRGYAIGELAMRLLAAMASLIGGGDAASQQRLATAVEVLPDMGPYEEPIDPLIAQILGLTFYKPGMRFHWCGQLWTFDEYMSRYLAYDKSW